MKKIQIMGLALVAMFAFSVVAAGSASANEWLVKKAAIAAGASVVVNITTKGQTLLLEDTATGTDVLCEGTGKGLVLPAGKDLQETVSVLVADCTLDAVGSCTKLEAVGGVFLSWETALEEPKAKEWLDKILKGTGGNPGWLVECNSILGKIDDTCTSTEGKPQATNLANETVELTFLAGEPLATCSLFGGKTGKVEGPVILEALSAGGAKEGLEVS
jgi:hypothetical protein